MTRQVRSDEPPAGTRDASVGPSGGSPRKTVVIYTDGACLGNPGPGGYGAILLFERHRKELSGGFNPTTNNRMELRAAIVALEALREPCNVVLHSDSEYVVKAMTLGWAERWEAAGWRLASRQPAANVDLWERLLAQCRRHQVTFRWVQGHAGDPENERADQLAMRAALGPSLPRDEGYQPSPRPGPRRGR